ncbi:MAG: DUF3592 domain-containing protein [Myxococcaceae bacterium]|nr:MAG: DUF3592 domain-containing protein [Myxococcaceae bacterium]
MGAEAPPGCLRVPSAVILSPPVEDVKRRQPPPTAAREDAMPIVTVLLFTVLAVGVPLVMVVLLLNAHHLTLKLRQEGLHAWGEVVSVRRSWMNARHRIVEYVFTLPDGSEIRSEYKQQANIFRGRGASEGDPLEVLYLPDNPHRHQRVGAEVGLAKALFGLGGLVLFMIMAVFLVMSGPTRKTPHRSGATPSRTLLEYKPWAPAKAPAQRNSHHRGSEH